jgi:hypothetical protein
MKSWDQPYNAPALKGRNGCALARLDVQWSFPRNFTLACPIPFLPFGTELQVRDHECVYKPAA